jgi:hypothetical protein
MINACYPFIPTRVGYTYFCDGVAATVVLPTRVGKHGRYIYSTGSPRFIPRCGEYGAGAGANLALALFIPTRVGNTPAQVRRALSEVGSPRVCGILPKHWPVRVLDAVHPLACGNTNALIVTISHFRFIPACGNTGCGLGGGWDAAVHPTCGD